MKKRNIKTFAFSDEFLKVLERVKESTRHTSYTAVIIQAVMTLDQKLNPAYKGAFMNRSLSPEEKADRQVEIEKAKELSKIEKYLAIAETLEGEVYEEGGEKRVQYYKYDGAYRDLQDIPIEMLTYNMIAEQYVPSREKVEKLRKQGKVNY